MKLLLLFTVVVFITSCGGEAPTEATNEATESDESTTVDVTQAETDAVTKSTDEALGDAAETIEAAFEAGIDKSDPAWKLNLVKPELMTFKPGQEILWKLETNVGDMTFKLFPDIAPMHTTSTIYLTELGFYDDIKFHRVITRFMAQGGDPLGTGQNGPGYEYDGEFSPEVRHDRPGLLSMANRGPGTDGSQFFLTFVPTPWLDDKHTIFGEIVTGTETLEELEKRGSGSGATSEPLMIVRATIERAM